ncbi:SPOR domain-containing protein [Microvirga roseola]|uniref:SPOR domain-containing protein n=1 Tax=Microvirga roseola TaxID=2883126 RepID=UPI001E629392|nr:SPOR domain-containing protein [Microvirga roseola]
MSESVKPRFAVDLNEIERQLAQAQGASSHQPAPATRNDPLAELARIVGQDDPFQSILASDGGSRPRQQAQAAVHDLYASRGGEVHHGRRGGYVEPSFEADPYQEVEVRGSEQAYGYRAPSPSQGEGAYAGGAYDNYYDENAGYPDPRYAEPEALDYPPVQRRRSRRGLVAIGAVLGFAAIGAGGYYALTDGPSTAASGEPPLVKASNEPVKVQPQNPGGVEIPNQNKQIYERAGNTETKVVNREEQPVDVKQAVRLNGGAVGDAMGGAAPQQPANGLNLGEPRKVRTVTIRPDGTVVGAEPANPGPAPAAAPLPTMTLPEAAQPAQAASATPSAAPVQPAPAAPKPVASTPAAVPATPAPVPAPSPATPASGSSPQQVASAQPVPLSPPAASAATPATVATGDYAVQLGIANSESRAEATLAQLRQKYSELESQPPLVMKAEVNGNTLYRIRVGPMSREEASSLCSTLQGQGAQCFVAKN